MSTSKLTRRTALAGAAALPAALAPLAFAESATEPDPFIAAFELYSAAERAYQRACHQAYDDLTADEEDAVLNAAGDAACAARLAMCQSEPTTAHGLFLAILALVPVFGEPKHGMGGEVDFYSLEQMEVGDPWSNGSGAALVRTLRTSAGRILGDAA